MKRFLLLIMSWACAISTVSAVEMHKYFCSTHQVNGVTHKKPLRQNDLIADLINNNQKPPFVEQILKKGRYFVCINQQKPATLVLSIKKTEINKIKAQFIGKEFQTSKDDDTLGTIFGLTAGTILSYFAIKLLKRYSLIQTTGKRFACALGIFLTTATLAKYYCEKLIMASNKNKYTAENLTDILHDYCDFIDNSQLHDLQQCLPKKGIDAYKTDHEYYYLTKAPIPENTCTKMESVMLNRFLVPVYCPSNG